jgi:hypothetical protein
LALVKCTFFENQAEYGSALYSCDLGVLQHCVIASSTGAAAVEGNGTAVATCCDVYGNAGGDWVGALAGQEGINGNICADPLFCDPENDDFTLGEGSPCAPGQNPDCGLVGAWPVTCGATPTPQTTWGALKALFRE